MDLSKSCRNWRREIWYMQLTRLISQMRKYRILPRVATTQSTNQSIINVVVAYLQQWDRQCITVSGWSLKTNKSLELCEKPGQNEGCWCEEESGSRYLDRRRRRRASRTIDRPSTCQCCSRVISVAPLTLVINTSINEFVSVATENTQSATCCWLGRNSSRAMLILISVSAAMVSFSLTSAAVDLVTFSTSMTESSSTREPYRRTEQHRNYSTTTCHQTRTSVTVQFTSYCFNPSLFKKTWNYVSIHKTTEGKDLRLKFCFSNIRWKFGDYLDAKVTKRHSLCICFIFQTRFYFIVSILNDNPSSALSPTLFIYLFIIRFIHTLNHSQ